MQITPTTIQAVEIRFVIHKESQISKSKSITSYIKRFKSVMFYENKIGWMEDDFSNNRMSMVLVLIPRKHGKNKSASFNEAIEKINKKFN